MSFEKVEVLERSLKGKGYNRRLRGEGWVPGVFYDQKGTNFMVKIKHNALQKAYRKFKSTQVFELEVDRGGKTESLPCLIWRIKYEPITGAPEHVDFFGVDLDKELTVKVPMVTKGRAKGVVKGGHLMVYREVFDVCAKPADLPEYIEIDITPLGIGKSIHIQDVAMPAGVKSVYEDNYLVLSILAKGALVDHEAELEEEAEAAAAAEGETEGEEEGEEASGEE